MIPRYKHARRWLASGLLIAVVVASGLLAPIASSVLAAPLAGAIDWWVVAAGGGPSSAGSVAIDSTVGQPITGDSAGSNVTLGAGYWYGVQARSILYLPAVLRH